MKQFQKKYIPCEHYLSIYYIFELTSKFCPNVGSHYSSTKRFFINAESFTMRVSLEIIFTIKISLTLNSRYRC